MKAKQLAILVVLAIVIGVLAYVSQQRDHQRTRPSGRIGKIVFPDLPINDIQKLVIIQAGATSVLARAENGKWGVPSRWNYPADFTRIADTLIMLSELKIQDVLQPTPKQVAAFKLQPPGSAESAAEAGVEVRLLGAGDEIIAGFLVGKERMRPMPADSNPMMNYGSFPDGQYVRQGNGPILLVSGRLGDLIDPGSRWLADDFINVSASDVMEMTIIGPGRPEIGLARQAPGELLVVSGVATNQEVDNAKLNQMAGAFNYLGFDDVADPNLAMADLGLSRPVRVTTRTRNNRTYVFDIGKTVSEADSSTYVKVSNSFVALPLTNALEDAAIDDAAREKQNNERKAHEDEVASLARETASFNERMTNWVFIVKSSRLDPLLVKRDELIKMKPVETNAPAPKVVSEPAPALSVEKADEKAN